MRKIRRSDRGGRCAFPTVAIGAVLPLYTVLYVVPRTGVHGAVLLTGRLENPVYTHTLFPVYFGVLIWAGPWLREPRVRAMLPSLR